MLVYLISCLSFLLFLSKSVSPNALQSWVTELRSLLVLFWPELMNLSLLGDSAYRNSATMASRKKSSPKVENVEEPRESLILDLPELALECILGRLSPAGLCTMASVCSSLREHCRSDHLWERHMKEKWGRLIGRAADREWKRFVGTRKDSGALDYGKSKGLFRSLTCMWPLSWLRSKIDCGSKPKSSLPADSIMSWYLLLESGKFWFPAQVYNREFMVPGTHPPPYCSPCRYHHRLKHEHVGFMLSCYDAELSYDCRTDTFHARYPPHGRRTIVIEEGVQWERLRAPPVDTPAHNLHVSDCLSDLRPGDHIEIQWRRNKEFPYGWWYGVVGHLESCDGNQHLCQCHNSDTVALEFNQYTPGSRWRRMIINRKDHREEGNEADGFYGGIRKLDSNEEILMWKRLWPKEVLE